MTKYIVYGLGISGIATAKYLSLNHADVTATDDSPNAIENFLKNHSKNYPKIKCQNPQNIKFDNETIISFSPGIPLFYPQKHPILEICKQSNAQLKCDIEIFYDFNQQNNFIGITGTNGKSTTTALTGFIFENLKIPSQIGGNIGVPCFELEQNQQNFTYIFETSSYQLDLISKTKYNIACLINITPDHIDRHGSFENYIKSKKRIFQNQTAQDFSIINIDNENCLKIYQEFLANPNHQSLLVATSTNKVLPRGISIIDNNIFIDIQQANQSFKHQQTFSPKLKGKHNLENISCALAISICHLIKTNQISVQKVEQIIKIIEEFQGLKHRMQLVRSINDINFINDSKATNAESTENALKSYDNIFWIVGGRSKEGGINILKPYFSKVSKAYLIGEASDAFAEIFQQNWVTFEKSQTLENAFKSAYSDASSSNLKHKNILLSPACSSFDQWKNFEQRGDYFCQLVNEIH